MTEKITIALTRHQVGNVVREATLARTQVGLEALLPGPAEVDRALRSLARNPNHSASLMRAVLVLAALPADGGLRELAEVVDSLSLTRSTVHRYLQTWIALGVVTQEPGFSQICTFRPSVRGASRNRDFAPRPIAAMLDVTLRLSESQIAQVCARAGLLPFSTSIQSGLADPDALAELDALLARVNRASKTKLSQSFVRGLIIFGALPADSQPIGIVDLAGKLGMSPSTVHRYLRTFVLVGLAEHDERTREYSRLGATTAP